MDYKKYLTMKNATISADIAEKLKKQGSNHITKFENKNDILTHKELHEDIGYTQMEDGNYIISSCVELPGMTAEMAQWWFWWHPREKERYMLWYPGEHFGISYPAKEKSYFEQKEQPDFKPNMQYSIERIGGITLSLSINFVTPKQFGYNEKLMKENGVATIICGHVGAFKDLVPHTEMSHICFQKENGLYMVNRFWLGQRAKNSVVRKFLLTDENAKGMAEHCYIEYRNFAKKIPMLYEEYLSELNH